ncbi:CLUMA_CG005049, isoform A [Clunio marinus]|uniref:CLUMA_CG005049, isoform A n=1 Tax=Clunio marinus TaxID=568069 RepID=A0A1J1HTI1_9DIPT|nr:CLUMA_CG005049, isoform A [Clunio marinus]
MNDIRSNERQTVLLSSLNRILKVFCQEFISYRISRQPTVKNFPKQSQAVCIFATYLLIMTSWKINHKSHYENQRTKKWHKISMTPFEKRFHVVIKVDAQLIPSSHLKESRLCETVGVTK